MIEPLEPREREAARLVAQGFTNDEIARHMKIKRHTAEVHVKKIGRKWNTTNRTEIAILALENVITLEEAQSAIRGKYVRP